jgi:hypothetical protein
MIWGDCSFKVSQASLTQQEFINSTAIPLVPAVLSRDFYGSLFLYFRCDAIVLKKWKTKGRG